MCFSSSWERCQRFGWVPLFLDFFSEMLHSADRMTRSRCRNSNITVSLRKSLSGKRISLENTWTSGIHIWLIHLQGSAPTVPPQVWRRTFVRSAWTPRSTASCWSVVTWLPAPNVARGWTSVRSAVSTSSAPSTCSVPEHTQGERLPGKPAHNNLSHAQG